MRGPTSRRAVRGSPTSRERIAAKADSIDPRGEGNFPGGVTVVRLLDRLRGEHREPAAAPAPLARDAVRMRATATGLHAERGGGGGEPGLRAIPGGRGGGAGAAPTRAAR